MLFLQPPPMARAGGFPQDAIQQPETKEKVMSNETAAIIKHSTTVSLTFTDKPDEATRTRLKAAGFKFENGNWYRNQTQGKSANTAELQQFLLTLAG